MELYEKPANLFVASFLGTANIVPGRVIEEGGQRVFEIDGGLRLPIPADAKVPQGAKLVFRPQHASLGATGARDVSLPGTVLHSEFLGSTVRYGVRLGSTEVSIDVPFQSGEAIHKPGAAVEVGLSLDAAVWLAS